MAKCAGPDKLAETTGAASPKRAILGTAQGTPADGRDRDLLGQQAGGFVLADVPTRALLPACLHREVGTRCRD
ncbi:hypothetical protein [Amycolatopsis dongchuanensis]|uniref:hypothetical protein n=1 Tax=Amycolatopsis TaxID=1813 RepID=UPI0031F99354